MPNKKLSQPIILICLFVFIAITIYISIAGMRSLLKEQSFNQLITIRDLQNTRLESAIKTMRGQVQNLADTPFAIKAMKDFSQNFYNVKKQNDIKNIDNSRTVSQNFYQNIFAPLFKKTTLYSPSKNTLSQLVNLPENSLLLQKYYIMENPNPTDEKSKLSFAKDNSNWSKSHEKYHRLFKNYLERNSIDDLLLVDLKKQNVVYSVAKQVDFATSLAIGPFQNSPLAYAYEDARSSLEPSFTKMTDLTAYFPAFGKPTSFISCPIYEDDKKIGVIIAKIYHHNINKIMADEKLWKRLGWGETTETYVIGRDNKMRSDSRMFVEKQQNYVSLLEREKSTLPSILASNTTVLLQNTDYYFAEKTGCEISTNYFGKRAIVAHASVSDLDLQWIVIAEQNLDESFLLLNELENALMILFGMILILLIVFTYITKQNKQQDILNATQKITNELSSIHQNINQVGKRGNKLLKKCETNIELTTNFHYKVQSFGKDFNQDEEQIQSIKSSFSDINQKLNDSRQQMQNFNKNLSNIDNALKQIKNMILIMENVAKETHIVSLNASIRAAREGNSSFSSVADEIRKLALKNARVLEKTSTKIDTAQKVVQKNDNDFQYIEKNTQTIDQQLQKASEILQKISDLKQRLSIYLESLTNQTQDAKFSCAYLQQDLRQIASESSNLTNQIEDVTYNLRNMGSAP
ncbi:methyl-accepting chemotaxis protein [Candidatus Uabimicrobium sp. HlEnr_7]|uniref:methyl-accepting chemotaxis protein n=1 Tax=Candidatus Uabimicrobium helgolandensis TaxID=3095367 RepID=UPI0035585A02